MLERSVNNLQVKFMEIATKRVYEEAAPDDGLRVLVDRLWPRGVSKEAAHLDLWLKEAAPSPELRKWFNHEPDKWPDFQKKYAEELLADSNALSALQKAAHGRSKVTLLYAAKDHQLNNAEVLKHFLESQGYFHA